MQQGRGKNTIVTELTVFFLFGLQSKDGPNSISTAAAEKSQTECTIQALCEGPIICRT